MPRLLNACPRLLNTCSLLSRILLRLVLVALVGITVLPPWQVYPLSPFTRPNEGLQDRYIGSDTRIFYINLQFFEEKVLSTHQSLVHYNDVYRIVGNFVGLIFRYQAIKRIFVVLFALRMSSQSVATIRIFVGWFFVLRLSVTKLLKPTNISRYSNRTMCDPTQLRVLTQRSSSIILCTRLLLLLFFLNREATQTVRV